MYTKKTKKLPSLSDGIRCHIRVEIMKDRNFCSNPVNYGPLSYLENKEEGAVVKDDEFYLNHVVSEMP